MNPALAAALSRHRKRSLLLGDAVVPSASLSTLVASPWGFTDGDTTVTVTTLNGQSTPIPDVLWTASATTTSVSASQSTVEVNVSTLAADGTAEATVTVTAKNADGTPLPDIPAASISVTSTGGGNTITADGAVTDQDGALAYTFTTTVAETKTISASIVSLAVTDTATLICTGFGAGANAPGYANTYPAEEFTTALPVQPASANAAGFYGIMGFDGYDGVTFTPTRTTYPTVATPIGTKQVLKISYPGQTDSITANGQSTASWPAYTPSYEQCSIRVSGTWVGTLEFEYSDNGGSSWSAATMTVRSGSGTTSTTGNGVWSDGTAASGRLYRVRASAWTSGTAVVSIGNEGGRSPVTARAGDFNASQGRMYSRTLIYISPTWSNNGNAGTKFYFFRGVDGEQNHYMDLNNGATDIARVVLQSGGGARTIDGASDTMPTGEWLDVEMQTITNTGANADGTLKVWVNGTLVINQTNVAWYALANAHTWNYLRIDSTYGGGWAPSPSTADTYYYIAAWYRESDT